MNDDRYKGLSDGERDALRAMAAGAVPRDGLEDDTVRVLSRQGLVRSGRSTVMRISAALGTLVAVGLVFIAGVTVGKRGEGTATVAPASANEKPYMLLLYMTAGERESDADSNDAAELAVIDEYRQWGARMAEQGRLVGAEKLKASALVMAGTATVRMDSAPADNGRVLGGYFIIRAKSLEHAQELASTHPHLKYGGEIEIRPLDLHD